MAKDVTKNDLFIRLLPAFNTKIAEWQREKIANIKSLDIWNYCVHNIWHKKENLRMYELVDDILNIDRIDFINYQKMKRNEEIER